MHALATEKKGWEKALSSSNIYKLKFFGLNSKKRAKRSSLTRGNADEGNAVHGEERALVRMEANNPHTHDKKLSFMFKMILSLFRGRIKRAIRDEQWSCEKNAFTSMSLLFGMVIQVSCLL